VSPLAPATAAATTATTATAAGATAAARAAAAAAFPRGTGFVDYQGPALKILTVAGLNGARRIFVVVDFSERKAPGLTRKPVSDHVHMVYPHSRLRKPVLQIRFGRLIGYITHVKFHV
jgi:hypothetical protein